jgi:Ca2+-binding EF-hand superfamily protein
MFVDYFYASINELHLLYLTAVSRQMHQLFQSADKNGDSILTLKEVVMLFRQMNLNSDLEHARRVFGVTAIYCAFAS